MIDKYLKSIKRLKINDGEWEYISEGVGKETFLILPGGGQTAQGNFQLFEEFKNKYKVIAITIFNTNSIDECCEAINKILEKESVVQDIILYGLSLGGLIAQSYLKRNKNKIKVLILSHACTPNSKTYKEKIIKPLKMLSLVLPLLPDNLIRFTSKRFAGQVQGSNKAFTVPNYSDEVKEALKYFSEEFGTKYMSKRLLKTWINLHLDFYNHEKFNKEDFADWKGKVLILRTDNDPMMQDEGEFEKIYPQAKVVTFKDTGHLTFYYQFPDTIKAIKQNI